MEKVDLIVWSVVKDLFVPYIYVLASISTTVFNSSFFSFFNRYIKGMKGNYFNLKKGFMLLHTFSGVLALFFILLFIQNGKSPWIYKSFLLVYIFSGVTILTIFFTTLPLFQRLYFELLFLLPLLVLAFWFFTKLFEYMFFGK
jgi:hypothetical protein